MSEQNFDPPGREFWDWVEGSKRQLKIVIDGSWIGWIIYKHPDGQWVSLRKASMDDLIMILSRVK